jgi:hypothetical protein
MADLRVKSTGKEFRRIDNGTAQLLEEMFPEALERINDKPRQFMADAASQTIVNRAVPVWGIRTGPITGRPAIQCDYARGVYYYDGAPEKAHEFKVGNFTPPEDLVRAYIAACANLPPLEKWRNGQGGQQ